MRARELFHLTVKDHSILEAFGRKLLTEPALSALLARKLRNCTLWGNDDIPPGVVTLNSRVSFRVAGGPAGDPAGSRPETRVVALSALGGNVGAVLPITNRRAMAMLGLSEGDTTTFDGVDGTPETLEVLSVLHQPEAARRALRQHDRERNRLRLVYSADTADIRQVLRILDRDGGDDPGPAAA